MKKGGVTLPARTGYAAKDQRKSDQATQFIGRGSARSSTDAYRRAWGERANSGQYTPEDVVFISAEGARAGALSAYDAMIRTAAAAGASFVTDGKADRARAYNCGEREVALLLLSLGYREVRDGYWVKDQPG